MAFLITIYAIVVFIDAAKKAGSSKLLWAIAGVFSFWVPCAIPVGIAYFLTMNSSDKVHIAVMWPTIILSFGFGLWSIQKTKAYMLTKFKKQTYS